MEQQRALNALEPFLALTKTTTSPRAAVDTIAQATSHPHTYVFAELLQQPSIQALRNTEYAPHLRLLEIFAWGTLEDYHGPPPQRPTHPPVNSPTPASSAPLPALSAAQEHKLRTLTLLTLLTRPATPTIDPQSYAYLLPRLALPDPLALEKLVQSALYASLLTGHIDPLHARLAVASVAPLRDLPPGALPGMTRVLGVWEDRCAETLAQIEAEIERIKTQARARAEQERRREKAFEEAVEKAKLPVGGGKAGWEDAEAMELDRAGGGGRGGKRRVGRRGGFGKI